MFMSGKFLKKLHQKEKRMKMLTRMTFLTAFNILCVACATPPTTKFTVHAVEESTFIPVTNAIVRTGFTSKYDPWGNEKNEYIKVTESVDISGKKTLEGKTVFSERGGMVWADGYYPTGFNTKSKHNRILNRWEPWNPTIEVKMRKIKDPVPMVYKSFLYKNIPNVADKFGFDFEIGDWVRPYGNGINPDIIVFYEKIEKSSKNDGGIQYTIKFPNALDGIQSYKFKNNQSTYEWPYVAPLEGYTSQLNKKYIWNFNGTSEGNIDRENQNDTNYIFRIRSKKDENGKITGMYGRIKNDVKILSSLTIEYWLNTDPNSRSLEYKDE